MTPRGRRIAKLEAAKRAKATLPVPFVLRVQFGQTIAEARTAFDAIYAPRPGHHFLAVPAKPNTDAEREAWEEQFHEQQSVLVTTARRLRVAAETPDRTAAETTPRHWPTSPVIRPSSGPHVIWKPQC